jgi:UDP-N-acetylglucosamine acyltransferase
MKENYIHPTAIIGDDVVFVGNNNYIGPYCYITGKTSIGSNNRFEAYCSIGTEPEHRAYFGKENAGLIIGDNNHFREYVTVNSGCEIPTTLGSKIIMLRGSHIGHDSKVHDGCTISCNVLIGGHSIIGTGVNMGLGSICHQFSKIGSYSMIGMGAIITKTFDSRCFGVYVGNPAKYIKENEYLKKLFSSEEIEKIISDFEKI